MRNLRVRLGHSRSGHGLTATESSDQEEVLPLYKVGAKYRHWEMQLAIVASSCSKSQVGRGHRPMGHRNYRGAVLGHHDDSVLLAFSRREEIRTLNVLQGTRPPSPPQKRLRRMPVASPWRPAQTISVFAIPWSPPSYHCPHHSLPLCEQHEHQHIAELRQGWNKPARLPEGAEKSPGGK